jgi:hypothetical protein
VQYDCSMSEVRNSVLYCTHTSPYCTWTENGFLPVYHCCICAILASHGRMRSMTTTAEHLEGDEIGRHFRARNCPHQNEVFTTAKLVFGPPQTTQRAEITHQVYVNGMDCLYSVRRNRCCRKAVEMESAGPATTCEAQRGPQLRDEHADELLDVRRELPPAGHGSLDVKMKEGGRSKVVVW